MSHGVGLARHISRSWSWGRPEVNVCEKEAGELLNEGEVTMSGPSYVSTLVLSLGLMDQDYLYS